MPEQSKKIFKTADEIKSACKFKSVNNGKEISIVKGHPLFKYHFRPWLDRMVSEEWDGDIVKMRPAKELFFYMTKKEYEKF